MRIGWLLLLLRLLLQVLLLRVNSMSMRECLRMVWVGLQIMNRRTDASSVGSIVQSLMGRSCVWQRSR